MFSFRFCWEDLVPRSPGKDFFYHSSSVREAQFVAKSGVISSIIVFSIS
jgi:hypothetical protein